MRCLEEDGHVGSADLPVDLAEIRQKYNQGFSVHPRHKGLQDHQGRDRGQAEEAVHEFQGSTEDRRELPGYPKA